MLTGFQHLYLHTVAEIATVKYGDDFYEALGVAEMIVRETNGDPEKDAQRVHAILEGEL